MRGYENAGGSLCPGLPCDGACRLREEEQIKIEGLAVSAGPLFMPFCVAVYGSVCGPYIWGSIGTQEGAKAACASFYGLI